jgi:hypothetical protein
MESLSDEMKLFPFDGKCVETALVKRMVLG